MVRDRKNSDRVKMWAPDWIPAQVLLREAEALRPNGFQEPNRRTDVTIFPKCVYTRK